MKYKVFGQKSPKCILLPLIPGVELGRANRLHLGTLPTWEGILGRKYVLILGGGEIKL